MSEIFILIPVNNRKTLTHRCLSCLNQQTYKKKGIIVIDDGSTDGTSDMISNEFREVTILRGDGNLWWTGAINLGLGYALPKAKNNDFILTLNDDVQFSPTYLYELIESALRHPDSLIGSINITNGPDQIIADGGVRINWLTAKYIELLKNCRYDSLLLSNRHLVSVDFLPGRGTIIPVKVFQMIGSYNSHLLPHYSADYEFSHRARKNGFGLFINYKAVLTNTADDDYYNKSGHDLKSFFSIKSANNFTYRWRFAYLVCPKFYAPVFFLLDTFRVLIGTFLKNIIRSGPGKRPITGSWPTSR